MYAIRSYYDPDDPEVLVDGKRRFKLAYTHEDPDGIPNTYSFAKKLIYWNVRAKGREVPAVYFSHLYLYKDVITSYSIHYTKLYDFKRQIRTNTTQITDMKEARL